MKPTCILQKTMNILIVILSFFFLFPLLHLVASIESCLNAVCQIEAPVVRFPFWIQSQQPKICGFPGFSVSCNSEGQTLLKLPYSGEFTIQEIDYSLQQLWINDPHNCLPKRILSFNLSGSPFDGIYFQDFTFFNCSLEYLKYRYNPIDCLSGSEYTVYATSNRNAFMYLSSVCNLVKTVKIPVGLPDYEPELSWDIGNDLRLSWDTPSCGKCELHGGRCGYKSNSSQGIGCCSVPQNGIPRSARYAITVGLGVPAVLCFIVVLCCLCGKIKYYSSRHDPIADFRTTVAPQPIVVGGLDVSTIESYPKLVLGESRRLPNPDDNTCSICLSEYKPKETLKSIPECQHCFHADCIDEWLLVNASCPICRKSPQKLPAVDVP
ncbi:putative Ring finger protein [Quillaja saponaria]|uniref:Ring finger protein n=1 Tax=Quillaja saponaria TaxID=32244 RepID=A0AAD7LVZ7_QUISA|nr:putative Ring finger protein [Quillaja saponaria]